MTEGKILITNRLHCLALLAGMLAWSGFQTNAQVYPVTVTVQYAGTPSAYLADYGSSENSRLYCSIRFNDLNEPSWNVFLRMILETQGIRIETDQNFRSPAPINLIPGVPIQLQGQELAELFDPGHLAVTGISKSELIRTGMLPEGNYTLTIQAYDYASGKLISNRGMSFLQIRLSDPPFIIQPVKGSVVPFSDIQNVLFRWNLVPNQAATSETMFYLYELNGLSMDPAIQVDENKALKIFESAISEPSGFLYSAEFPVLLKGHAYAWRVQSKAAGNREYFKNHGYSETSWFWYGYPAGGSIALLEPADNHNLGFREDQYFKWSIASNLTRGQVCKYILEVFERKENQEEEEALGTPSWYRKETSERGSVPFNDLVADKKMNPNTEYLWRVRAYTQGELIAESPVYHLFGPPVLESFKAGNQKIKVTRIQSGNLRDFAGEGLVRTDSSGNTIKATFSHLYLVNIGGEYKLREGEIRLNLKPVTFILTPENPVNDNACFVADSLLLSRDKFCIHGRVEWDIPHLVMPGSSEKMHSLPGWLDFDDYCIIGELPVDPRDSFELAEPSNFRMYTGKGSYFLIRGHHQYKIGINGTLQYMPGFGNQPLRFPFYGADQLGTMDCYAPEPSEVNIAGDAGLVLQMTQARIDLYGNLHKSSPDLSGGLKGIFVDEFKIVLKPSRTKGAQLYRNEAIVFQSRSDTLYRNYLRIDQRGIQLSFKDSSLKNGTIKFNGFHARIECLSFSVQNNNLAGGMLRGGVKIPLITGSDLAKFSIPFDSRDFMQGYLDKSLDGTEWIFNPEGKDQLIRLNIKRAVFEDNCCLSIQAQLNWPYMHISDLAMDNLKIWGNGDFGMQKPNGSTALAYPVTVPMQGYPYELSQIGAGYSNGCYAIGIAGNINIGEDVAGKDGPPLVNLYSIMRVEPDSGTFSLNNLNDRIADQEVQDILIEAKDDEPTKNCDKVKAKLAEYTSQYDSVTNQLNNQKYDIFDAIVSKSHFQTAASDSSPPGVNYFNMNNESSIPKFSPRDIASQITPADVIAIIDFLSSGIDNSQSVRLQKIKAFIAGLSQPELRIIYIHLTDVGNLIQGTLNDLVSGASGKIKELTDDINGHFRNTIGKFTAETNSEIGKKLDAFFSQIRKEIAASVNGLSPEDLQLLDESIRIVSEDLNREIQQSLSTAVDRNITAYFTDSLTGKVYKRLDYALREELCRNAWEDIKEGTFNIPVQTVLQGISKDIQQQIDFENLKKVIQTFGNDIFASVNLRDTYDKLMEKFGGQLLRKLDLVKENLGPKLENLEAAIKSKIDDLPSLPVDNVDLGLSLDFRNLGDKVKKGDLTGIVKLDPVYISGSSKLCKYQGMIEFRKNEPGFGDVWKGNIQLIVNSPLAFSIGATYINGKKDNTNYWFLQIEPVNEKEGSKQQNKQPKVLKNPMNIGFVKLVAVSGMVFHHMNDKQASPIPDPAIEYGAYLGFVLFDGNGNGKILRAEVASRFTMNQGKDYEVNLNGNLQCGSSNYSVLQGDPNAAVKGTVALYYNSAEKHFIGSGDVQVLKPNVLCARGTIYLDISPGKWALEVGSREDRLVFQPGCKGWTPTGWLALNQSKAEIGLGIQLSLTSELTLKLKIIDIGLYIDAGIAAGIEAVINYKPFGIDELGVWADLWAVIMINYAIHIPPGKHGSINLVDIRCKADLIFRFSPSPVSLIGDIRGHCKILGCIGCSFKGHMERRLG